MCFVTIFLSLNAILQKKIFFYNVHIYLDKSIEIK